MEGRMRAIRRRATALALTAVAVVALGGTALAGHIASDVKSYTGCLASGEGVVVKVKEGDAPKSACTSGQTQVHLSGGDITKVSVTGALTGGGDNGEITIGLKPEATLPSGCANGRVAQSNGSAWVCGEDNDTTYTADGQTLDLSGTQFSIASAYRVKSTQSCSSGQFATAIVNGDIRCAAPTPPASTPYFNAANQPNYNGGDGIPDDNAFHVYAQLTVPGPGVYLVQAKGSVKSQQNIEENGAGAVCRINKGNGFLLDNVEFLSDQLDDNWQTTFALSGVATVPDNVVQLACKAENGADGLALMNGRILVIQVG